MKGLPHNCYNIKYKIIEQTFQMLNLLLLLLEIETTSKPLINFNESILQVIYMLKYIDLNGYLVLIKKIVILQLILQQMICTCMVLVD